MTTVATLIGQTRRHLVGMSRGSLNRLDADIGISTTTAVATFDLGTSIAKNAYIAIDDEIMYVYDVDQTAKSITMERAQLGTTGNGHSAGTQIECNPRFPKPVIRDALQQEIASWPRTVYQVSAVSLNVPTNNLSVDCAGIPANFYEILEVVRRPNTASSQQQLSSLSTSWPEVGFRYERNMAVTDYPSGTALFLNSSQFGGYTVRVTFSAPFTVSIFDDSTDLEATCGLARSMIDIPPFGAAATLLAGRESSRSAMEAQGEARAPVEVPVGATLRSASGLQQWRDKRLTEEGIRLIGDNGWRRTG